jgi:hypothetical protein
MAISSPRDRVSASRVGCQHSLSQSLSGDGSLKGVAKRQPNEACVVLPFDDASDVARVSASRSLPERANPAALVLADDYRIEHTTLQVAEGPHHDAMPLGKKRSSVR